MSNYGQRIVLNNVTFSNPNLPVLTQIVERNHLKFGLKPNVIGFNSLTNSDVVFSYRGEPEKLANSVVCIPPQGIETTQLETQALTQIVICRIKKAASGATPYTTIIGGSNTGGAGFSLLTSGPNFANMIFSEKAGTQQFALTSMGPYQLDPDGEHTKWAWLAVVIDPATNHHAYFNSHTITGYLNNDAAAGGYNLASRNVSAGRPVFVGTSLNPSASNVGSCEVAGSYYFDSALTEAQLRQQYAYDKAAFAKVGIVI